MEYYFIGRIQIYGITNCLGANNGAEDLFSKIGKILNNFLHGGKLLVVGAPVFMTEELLEILGYGRRIVILNWKIDLGIFWARQNKKQEIKNFFSENIPRGIPNTQQLIICNSVAYPRSLTSQTSGICKFIVSSRFSYLNASLEFACLGAQNAIYSKT